MAKIERMSRRHTASTAWRTPVICACPRASMLNTIVKGVQPIAFENAVWAYTLGVRTGAEKRRKERRRSCRGHRRWACRPSAFPALLLNSATSAWATAISALCCCVRRPSASASWQDTNPLRRRKAPSVLPAPPIRSVRNRCGSSSTVLGKDAAYIISTHQRLHLCGNGLRFLHRRAEGCRRERVLRRRTSARFAAMAPTMCSRALPS